MDPTAFSVHAEGGGEGYTLHGYTGVDKERYKHIHPELRFTDGGEEG